MTSGGKPTQGTKGQRTPLTSRPAWILSRLHPHPTPTQATAMLRKGLSALAMAAASVSVVKE